MEVSGREVVLTSLTWERPAWLQSCLWNVPALVLILKPLKRLWPAADVVSTIPMSPGPHHLRVLQPRVNCKYVHLFGDFPQSRRWQPKGPAVSTPQARTDRSQCINTPVPTPPEQGSCSHGFPESPGRNHCRRPQWRL